MFTGLIRSIGKISLQSKGVFIEVPNSSLNLSLGDSVAVNGVCLTVASIRPNGFFADVSEETLKRTTLFQKSKNQEYVNLEPAVSLSDPLGGHLVSGHVDGLGKVSSIEKLLNSWDLTIYWEDRKYAKYVCEKASIAVNGVSLTISDVKEAGICFSIAVIPHSWNNTALKHLSRGDQVNLEADLIAKYAERLLMSKGSDSSMNLKNYSETISKEWLSEHGW